MSSDVELVGEITAARNSASYLREGTLSSFPEVFFERSYIYLGRSSLIRGPFRALHDDKLVIAATGYSRDFKKLMKSPTWSGSSRNSGMRG